VPPDNPLDQAAGLRQLLGGDAGLRAVGVFGGAEHLTAQATANLASAMAQRGAHTWIFDELAAPGTVAAQFGLTPPLSLDRLLSGAYRLGQVFSETPAGPRLLACAHAARSVAASPQEAWSRLAKAFTEAAPDWLFLTAPNDGQASLAYAAPARILVVPGGKSHLTEAYALLKAVHQQQPEGRWWILFMNLAEPERAGLMMQAITETSRRFLEVEPGYLGVIGQDNKLELAARAMRPVLDFAPACGAATAFRSAAETLVQVVPAVSGSHIAQFWLRMGLLSRRLAAAPNNRATDYRHGGLYR
jgi:flagellar biosynthesis protein FlhG